MANLTDRKIQNAITHVAKLRKQQMLTDDDVRGTDRLVLILKLMPSWITAEWMAQQWRDGRRVKAKIGSCPTLTLLQTRKIFACDFSGVILQQVPQYQDSRRHPSRHRRRPLRRICKST
jgi:hypothetical protein